MSVQKNCWLLVAYCLVLFSNKGWAYEDSPNSPGHIESSLMICVAIVTAIIGAITGIAGSIMGYVAYRRSNEIKKSDRRLDLHELTTDAQLAADGLLETLRQALKSRREGLSARGILHSSFMAQFATQHEEDSKRATELLNQIPTVAEDVDYDSMSLRQLEQEFARIYKIKGKIDQLNGKYRDSIEQDQNDRIRR